MGRDGANRPPTADSSREGHRRVSGAQKKESNATLKFFDRHNTGHTAGGQTRRILRYRSFIGDSV